MKLVARCLWSTGRRGSKAVSTLTWPVTDRNHAEQMTQEIVKLFDNSPDYIFLYGGEEDIIGGLLRPKDLRSMTFKVVEDESDD